MNLDEYRALMAGFDLPDLTTLKPSWHARANCIGKTDLFFPERGEDARPAKALCARCPVIDECRAYGDGEAIGIWGGTSRRERRRQHLDAA